MLKYVKYFVIRTTTQSFDGKAHPVTLQGPSAACGSKPQCQLLQLPWPRHGVG